MNLTEHFSLEQLTASGIALRKGLSNVPNDEQVAHLTLLAQTLEQVRALLGPFHIDSAFRSSEINAAVGGSAHSAHLDGYAADIVAPGFGTPLAVCEAIASSGIPFDQLIQEGGERGWTHISVAPTMRGEILTARFINGKAIYSQGLVQEDRKTS
jgi:hypothetical protein